MYVLVPYNLSDIQKGIQAAHAISVFVYQNKNTKKVKQWVEDDKTIIVLNGGTTGKNGTLQQYLLDLDKLSVARAVFQEPDLNDATTAVAFVLDMEEDTHIIGYLKQMGLA